MFPISTYTIIITTIMFRKAVSRSWSDTKEMKKVYTDSWFRWCSWAILCFWVSWKKLKKSTDSNTRARLRFLAASMNLSMFRRLSTRRLIVVIVTDTTTTTTTTIRHVSEDLLVWFGLIWHIIGYWFWFDFPFEIRLSYCIIFVCS